jgi:hypothetical protein
MSHWFDRLATWTADGPAEGEQRLLTRRQAVRAAATGAGTIGLLGSPLLGKALAEHPGCDCARKVGDNADRTLNKLTDDLILNPLTLVSPLGAAIWLVAGTGLYAGALAKQLGHCGVAGQDCGPGLPSGKPPPPNAQPCTHRGGRRMRGDQCGGDVTAPPGGSGCGEGTTSCNDSSGLCCFGDDLCCGCNCCIAVVGCTCCG